MLDTLKRAVALLKVNESFAMSCVLTSSGSTPRGVGSWMLVETNGKIAGTVGGGILESYVINTSITSLKQKQGCVIDVTLDGNDAAASGMICGGSAKILIGYIDSNNENNLLYYEELLRIIAQNEVVKVVSVIPDNGIIVGRNQCFVMSDSSVFGEYGFDTDVLKSIKNINNVHDTYIKLDQWQFYIEEIDSPGTAYIFGAGHCGEKLCPLLKTLGFNVVVIDDRAEFANRNRFPSADLIKVPDSFDDICSSLSIDDNSYLIIITRGHLHDETVLRQCLITNACYIGMIGSTKKRSTIYSHLLAEGFTRDDIEKVHSPIGLSISAKTPEEIAVSIAAELIANRAYFKDKKQNR